MTEHESVTLRDFLERAFRDHETSHSLLSLSIDRTQLAHEKLHESQKETAVELFAGHRDVHVSHDAAHAREHLNQEGNFTRFETNNAKLLEALSARLDVQRATVVELEKRGANLDGKIAMLGVGLTIVVIVINVGIKLLAP